LQVHDLAGDELGDGEPDDIGDGVKVVDDAPHLAVVSPSGSAPRPSTSSLLSMVSTSKWMATREQPVAASQSSSGWVASRRSSGLKERMPHWATLAMSSLAQACSPTNATRSEDDLFGLDPIDQLQAGVVHGDRRGCGWALVGGQDSGQHGRADGIAPAGHREGELRREGLDAGGAGALPLRPQQPQGHIVGVDIAPRRGSLLGHVVLPHCP
jgi:hypothetical protein